MHQYPIATLKKCLTSFLLILFLFFSPDYLQAENPIPNGGLNPIYSPDGNKIAFISSTLHTQDDIWIMDSDGSNPRRLTFSGGYNASWFPDSKYIYYQKKHTGYRVYWKINVEGKPIEEKFITLPEDSTGMVLSPDGKRTAFLTKKDKFKDLWVTDMDSGEKIGLTENFGVRSYQWMSDGKGLFFEVGFVYGVGILSVNTETLDIKRIYNGYVGRPVYSKEANKLAFSTPLGGKKYHVKIINPDETGLESLDTPHLGGLDIAWSAKGDQIHYIGPDDKGESSLWSFSLSTRKEKRIIPEGYEINSYAFSPDGKTLTFSGATKNNYAPEIWQIKYQDKASSDLWEKLTSIFSKNPPPQNIIKSSYSQWSPASSPDGRFVAYISSINRSGVVEIVEIASGKKISIDKLYLDHRSKIVWLSEPEQLAVYNKQSIQIFNFKGQTSSTFFKEIFFVDANLRENKILVNAVKNFNENPRIFLLEIEDMKIKKETLLADEQEKPANPPADVQPKWSFKGDKIIFIREYAVWKMNADGSNREKLISFKTEDKGVQAVISDPAWSIKDDRITFTVSKLIDDNLFLEIWVMNQDGSDAKSLVSYMADSDFYMYAGDFTYPPFFNASGDKIIYTSVFNGQPNIFEINLAGGKSKELTTKGGIFPTLFLDEGIILYISPAENIERLYMMNTDGTDKKLF